MKQFRRYRNGLFMSLGMFTALPLPYQKWEETSVNLLLAYMPLAGGAVGAIWLLAYRLLNSSGLTGLLPAAVLALLPFLLTGFLHLDGYMDTSDALLSRRPLADKLKILKDPHVGAFAVIMLAVLFLLQFAGLAELMDNAGLGAEGGGAFVVIPILSRCCAALAVLGLPLMPQSGFAKMLRQGTGKGQQAFVLAVAAATLLTLWLVGDGKGMVAALAVVLGFSGAMAYAYREFQGVSGDLAGFSLVLGELAGLLAWAFAAHMG